MCVAVLEFCHRLFYTILKNTFMSKIFLPILGYVTVPTRCHIFIISKTFNIPCIYRQEGIRYSLTHLSHRNLEYLLKCPSNIQWYVRMERNHLIKTIEKLLQKFWFITKCSSISRHFSTFIQKLCFLFGIWLFSYGHFYDQFRYEIARALNYKSEFYGAIRDDSTLNAREWRKMDGWPCYGAFHNFSILFTVHMCPGYVYGFTSSPSSQFTLYMWNTSMCVYT